MNGIYFFNVVWALTDGRFDQTIEAATSRRWLTDHIRKGDVRHPLDAAASPVKVQDIETPVIDFAWLVRTFETGTSKHERKEHAEEAAYVLRLVEKLAARVLYAKNDGEEELVER